jgi:hypothetical protein
MNFGLRGALVAALILVPLTAFAAESPGKRDAGGMPKGSFAASCACQFSGGALLSCFCNNIQAKWIRSTMDVRQCAAPKDIKNCEGVLTCTDGASAQCPAPGAATASTPVAAKKH